MPTIWKTELLLTDVQQIYVPHGTEFLCAREQFHHICVWYRCEPSHDLVPRYIAIIGTGRAAPEAKESKYLGTASLDGGTLIFHVFERLS